MAQNLLKKLPLMQKIFGEDSLSTYYEKMNLKANQFTFSEVSYETVESLLMGIEPSKAAGIDNINGRFINDGANILAFPITQICNLSIKFSSFPSDCKLAKLKPIFKKGSKTEPKNFRPIFLLPLISKIIEKVIHNQTDQYLSSNKILFKYQSGFRKNHSTNSTLSYLTDSILKGFDTGMCTGMILIDLQKAFDTIDHKLLLQKMLYLGFSTNVTNWFESYLSNRTFVVDVNRNISTAAKLTCGVPQGSILGPLLFLLYVNDMPQSIKSNILLYADDSCIYFQHSDVKTIERQLNEDFSSLCHWFVNNKLSIHFGEDKTKSILFANKYKIKKLEKLNITYNNIKIIQHSRVSYLGCILNNTLSGESMALNVINKVNLRLRFLYRNNRYLTPYLRRLLCNALIQPNFDYAIFAWYPNLNTNLKKRIQIAQNKCIRFCLQLDNRSHIGFKEFEKIDWLDTADRFKQILGTTVFKFFKSESPDYMSDLFKPARQNNINTRSTYLKLIQPFRKTNAGQNTLSYQGPGEWIKLPIFLKKETNINSFKHKVKIHYLNEFKNKELMN